jgi:class 3 adenylate cyclase/DNA-binding transcriptional MerR regulator
MLDSKQLIEKTGISRATLNNYVAQGILPNPTVMTPQGGDSRATRLGYFEDGAVDIINRVKQLKKEGLTMAQIADQLGRKTTRSNATIGQTHSPAPRESGAYSGQPVATVPEHLSLESSVENFPGPAYMVNNNMEVIWWNEQAGDSFFSNEDELPGEVESRSLLRLLFNTRFASDPDHLRELIKPHVAAGKRRLSHQALIKIYSALDADQLSLLKDCYENTEALDNEPVIHYPAMLPADPDTGSTPQPCDLYISFYREGILFTFSPVELNSDYLVDFLRKRNHVINELLKKRKPYLTNVTVMVADVQNSTRICSELPAEEYFELINSIWQRSEPIFRKYYGTYGKHAGDGMVYYFFPQPDCDYKLNAIRCSLELQKMMKAITLEWQSRKGWFSDIFLNIGLNEGQEWFGSYHAGGHVEFTVLGETINSASRISDFARNGSVWATKNMLNQVPGPTRQKINFGITRVTHSDESVFVTDTYASLGSLLDESRIGNRKFRDVGTLPITEIRSIET